MRSNRGFTLIELLVTLVVIAIFAMMAMATYQQYIQRKDLAIAKQEALRLATELEKFKGKNFSYKGFDPSSFVSGYVTTTGEMNLPLGASSSDAKYVLTLRDLDVNQPLSIITDPGSGNETTDSSSVNGLGWAIIVKRAVDSSSLPRQPKNYDLLLTSNGLRCMSKTNGAFDGFSASKSTCALNDTNSETWE